MEIQTAVIIVIILVFLVVVGVGLLLKLGKVALSILLHILAGEILLFIWNMLPFFKIPINLLSVLVAGFGGIFGTGVLILAKAMGFY